jgi:Co/Zn/Cd efflux system component
MKGGEAMFLYEALMLIVAVVTCISNAYVAFMMHKSSKRNGKKPPSTDKTSG